MRDDEDAVRGRRRARRRSHALAWLFLLTGAVYAQEPDALAGRADGAVPTGNVAAGHGRFGLCESCHGVRAEGNAGLGAPALAGLQPWYVRRQLDNYRSGRRGTLPGDVRGQQMRAMAQTLESQAAVEDVVAYLATLEPVAPVQTVEGDAVHGKELYTTCVSCHGDQAQGHEAMQAPSLRHNSDWYLVHQLEAFTKGLRGSADGDTYGMQMRTMSTIVGDDVARRDVVAYIATLKVP